MQRGVGNSLIVNSSYFTYLLVIQDVVLQAGFNKYRDTQSGDNNAKLYNEMVIFKILEVGN